MGERGVVGTLSVDRSGGISATWPGGVPRRRPVMRRFQFHATGRRHGMALSQATGCRHSELLDPFPECRRSIRSGTREDQDREGQQIGQHQKQVKRDLMVVDL